MLYSSLKRFPFTIFWKSIIIFNKNFLKCPFFKNTVCLAKKERKFDSKKINEMKSYVFDDKYKLKTGELISEFDLEILKIQSNPFFKYF